MDKKWWVKWGRFLWIKGSNFYYGPYSENRLSVLTSDQNYYPVRNFNPIWMIKIVHLIRRVALFSFILALSGCYYDKIEEGTIPQQVSFTTDIQPIFNTNCTSCHPTLVSPPDLSSGNSYNSITNGDYIIGNDLDGSTLYQRLLGNPSIMPPSGSLSASEINLVKNWIEQGALNN